MRHGGRAPGVLWLPPCKCHRASREHRVQKDDRKALGSIEGTSHRVQRGGSSQLRPPRRIDLFNPRPSRRSEEHTSELQSLMRTSYAVFCLKKKKNYRNLL